MKSVPSRIQDAGKGRNQNGGRAIPHAGKAETMKTYTQVDIERMEEIRDEMQGLMAEIKRITNGDGHTEAYFTNHLDSLINGGFNRYDMDFDKIIDNMRESLDGAEDEEEAYAN